MSRIISCIIVAAAISIAAGCSSGRHSDPRLDRVAELASTSPRQALDSLAAIDCSRLAEADRHYYDLLSIKAADKADLPLTSDSLILDVLDYFASHQDSGHYPEALYYGGRVYCEMGDYPTALKYFQDALDLTPIESNITLRGNILSQTGWILHQLKLHKESIPYLKEVLVVDSVEEDLNNLVYDNLLIGMSYLKLNNVDSATTYFNLSKNWAANLTKSDEENVNIFLARTEMYRKRYDSAVSLIRNTPLHATSHFRNMALMNAAEIYMRAGIFDTAYMYANELVHTIDPNNHKPGYHILLSPGVLPLSPSDSLSQYFRKYYYILEDHYDKHESQLALLQQTNYNYNLHVRERLKAEEKRNEIFIWWCVAVIVALILLVIALFYRIRSKQTLIKLNNTLAKLTLLQKMIGDSKADEIAVLPTTLDALQDQVKRKLEEIEQANIDVKVSDSIVNSPTYGELQRIIKDKGSLSDNNEFWQDLFSMVESSSPEMVQRLEMLSGAVLKLHERQTIALIKCGLSLSQMAQLLSKTKATIYSRREALCLKLVGEKIDLKLFDALIRQM